MSRIIIVFASMTGNTEEMADAIAEGLKEAGIEPVVKNVIDTNAEEITHYDGYHTWQLHMGRRRFSRRLPRLLR